MMKVVFSRCPVGTATDLILKNGWLKNAFEKYGAELCILQTMDPACHKSHFTQESPLHFRDGGNIPPMWAQSQGDRSVLLGVSYQKEMRGIFVRQDSDIKTIEDLKGKRIAIPVRPDAVVDFRYLTMLHGFESILGYYGIKMSDVELRRILCKNIVSKINKNLDTMHKDSDFMTEDFQAVLDGTADAVFANSIKEVRHKRAGILRNILSEEDQRKIPNLNNNAVLAITCTKPFAYEHPELVIAYLTELIKAGYWIKENPQLFIESSASSIYEATPDEMINSFEWTTLMNRVPELSDRGLALLSEQKEFMIKWGLMEKERDFDVRTWADESFLKAAFQKVKEEV